jgi:type II secretory pathway pseudopilin PulG
MRRGRRGFTVIEAVTAIIILAISVPPMLWAIRAAHAQRANPVMASHARWLAVERLEEVIRDRHSTTRGYTYLQPGNYSFENPVTGWPGYTRAVQLFETGADLVTPGAGYMNVTVTVSWTDGAGDPRSIDVATILTEYTP